jgi:hypothetical protein
MPANTTRTILPTRNETFGLFCLVVQSRVLYFSDLSLVCSSIQINWSVCSVLRHLSRFLRCQFPNVLWSHHGYPSEILVFSKPCMRWNTAWSDSALNKGSSTHADSWLFNLTFGLEIQFTLAVTKMRSYVDRQSLLQVSSNAEPWR